MKGLPTLKLAFTKRQTPQRSRDFLKHHQHTETHWDSHYDDRNRRIKLPKCQTKFQSNTFQRKERENKGELTLLSGKFHPKWLMQTNICRRQQQENHLLTSVREWLLRVIQHVSLMTLAASVRSLICARTCLRDHGEEPKTPPIRQQNEREDCILQRMFTHKWTHTS